MRNRPTSNETTTQNATSTNDDAVVLAVNRWLENRRGRNVRGAAESSGRFESNGTRGSWRLYPKNFGKKDGFLLWVLVAPFKYTRARLPDVPETATAELRAKWSELAAPRLFDAYHAAKKGTVVATAKKAPRARKR